MDGFTILSKLGDGSYSVVYKVRRKEDGNIYALKKVKMLNLNEKEKQNSLNEVRILASVKSQFVISYKEAFIEDSDKSLCIVMEYADKGDLYQKITEFRKNHYLIDEIDVWRIFIQMVRGLKSLHDLKILHRDLKSANIFLFSDGSAKIGDLNVSKVAYKGLGYTQTGTPYYASPEVWKDKPYDKKSDIWSLGCVLYEMLTLYPPFRAESMDGLYKKVIKGQYNKIDSRYSKDISEIIKLLLTVDIKNRPTCDEILKNKIIINRIEFFKAQAGFEDYDIDDMDEGTLLKTIKISDDILNLKNKLPDPNYESIIAKKKIKICVDDNNSVNTNSNSNKTIDDEKKVKRNMIHNMNSLPSINSRFSSQVMENTIDSKDNIITNKENTNKNNLISPNHVINTETIKNSKKKIKLEAFSPQPGNSRAKLIKEDSCFNSADNKHKNVIDEEHRKFNIKIKEYNKKQKDIREYLQNIGLGDIYKIYKPQLENRSKNKNNHNLVANRKINSLLPSICIINNTNNYNYFGSNSSNKRKIKIINKARK